MFEKLFDRVEQAAMLGAGLAVVAIMLIICYDAATRYLFHAPLPWAFEVVTYYLLVSSVYLGAASTFTHGDHVNIDLFHARYSPRWQARADAVCGILAACLFALIAFGAGSEAAQAFKRHEFYPGYTTWPVWLSYVPVAIGSGLLVVRLLLHAFLRLMREGERLPASRLSGHAK